MNKSTVTVSGISMTVYSLNTVVVGSGAAGLNSADRLYDFGQHDIAIVTEGMTMGTSRNTGSDKQTYYKLTLAGSAGDSVYEMAETLFCGGAMHGDTALVEAALSTRCFDRLVDLGVPFPHDRYGQYVGYKTDHDPRQRATSAGPLTSRYITERLEEEVTRKSITVFDGFQVIAVLTDGDGECAVGLLALDTNKLGDPSRRFVLFNCVNIVYAVGGPAGMYGASVYPASQSGATGIALEAGAPARNLTETQFGIASTGFRWNLSGTYQQVLPRYISTDADGEDAREFLDGYFPDTRRMLDAVFLKGYQWPFDPAKIHDYGSSLIDVLVYHETVIRGRRVFLDYTVNPSRVETGGGLDASLPGDAARSYLERSGAFFGTPVERLKHMNLPAYELFRDNGVDLTRDPLEIAVSAQHSNGGLAVNIWWESSLRGFFPVGEVAGTHGVYRPGGSALNAGQVGSTRASQYIARRGAEFPPSPEAFLGACRGKVERTLDLGRRFLASSAGGSTVTAIRKEIGERMDRCGGIIRSAATAREGMAETERALKTLPDDMCLNGPEELSSAYRNRDLLLSQYAWLSAIADYIERGGKSRGSFIVTDSVGDLPAKGLPETFRFSSDGGAHAGASQVVTFSGDGCRFEWEDVRPIPEDEGWFETVWRGFLDDGNVR